MFELKISEAKIGKDGVKTRTVKRGGKLFAELKMAKGQPSVLWCTEHSVRRSSVNRHLIMVRRSIALAARRTCPEVVGVRFADGSTYKLSYKDLVEAAHEGDFFCVEEAKWEAEIPPEEDRVEFVMAKMRVPGGRRRKSAMTAPA